VSVCSPEKGQARAALSALITSGTAAIASFIVLEASAFLVGVKDPTHPTPSPRRWPLHAACPQREEELDGVTCPRLALAAPLHSRSWWTDAAAERRAREREEDGQKQKTEI
jgi:hypothetical protein